MKKPITLRGCRQHNLKGFDIEIPRGKYVAITGVSGSGKSTLAIDTLYAEGQRRYVESFSAYARQFLERMDRPAVDSVENIPPAVAITQGNHIRNARSTVGTVTEINDYIKILFGRLGIRHCDKCGKPVERRTPAQIADKLLQETKEGDPLLFGFAANQEPAEYQKQGFLRAWVQGEVVRLDAMRAPGKKKWMIVLDRIAAGKKKRSRIIEALEQAFAHGKGRAAVFTGKWLQFDRELRCPRCDIRYQPHTPNQFSFNSPVGACPDCKGFGRIIEIDPSLVIPDPTRSLAEGAIKPWTTQKTHWETEELHKVCRRKKISLHTAWEDLPEAQKQFLYDGEEGGWKAGKWFGVRGWFGWLETKIYKLHVRVLLSRYRVYNTCKLCAGTRFKKETLQTKLGGKNIAEMQALPLSSLKRCFAELELPGEAESSVGTVLTEVRNRLGYLCEVGLDYLTLNRSSRSLSGGELQRVNLTTAVGSSLVNTLFVLDEPSIGLHPRDNDRLIGTFRRLTDRQNTVVVIEHDPAILTAADQLIDLGPRAGEAGGELIYQGSVAGIKKDKKSATGRYIAGKLAMPGLTPRKGKRFLEVKGATAHNLKNISAQFPLGAMTCVTGVSGSGKSTLVDSVLYRGLLRRRGEPVEAPGSCKGIKGWQAFDFVSLVDQSALSRSPKSTVASHAGIHSRMQKLLAGTDAAKKSRLQANAFSTGGRGRCPQCEGSGHEKIEMQFLADIFIPCPECGGKRFRPEILKIRYRGKNLLEMYDLTVEQACLFFRGTKIEEELTLLEDVGLGYLRLGQALNTLSGGEAQRLKLGLALSARGKGTGLFLLDEPTTGLHGSDLPPLIRTLEKLLQHGHTLIIIEHNLDLIRLADHVIDLGPEGGEAGGEILVAGSPEAIRKHRKSITGRYLSEATSGKVEVPA